MTTDVYGELFVPAQESCDSSGLGKYVATPGYENYGKRSSAITAIVLSSTNGMSYAEGFSKYALNKNESVHYLIGENGRIDNLVPISCRANHVKNASYWNQKSNVNDFSISIALEHAASPLKCYPTIYTSYEKIKNGECNMSGFSSYQIKTLSKILKCLTFMYNIVKFLESS